MSNPPPIYNGRYELSHQIARGGTAQVYLARDLLLDRPVALKMLFPELSADHSFVDRFRREAQAAANLSHPNIVPVFDWGESERTYYIVMEYIDGSPLSAIIRREGSIKAREAAPIGIDIAKALSYAHRHGVVHRDIKPGNVLITTDAQVKVTDFGIARAIGTDENVTQTGLVMGTATYFSPEQAQGLGVDGRSDIYSLGVVLYEMVTGRPPFSGDSPVAIAYQHVRENPPPPRLLNPAVPPAFEAIIMQAMAKLPAERYPTAQDLGSDLQRFAQGATVLAHPPITGVTAAQIQSELLPLQQSSPTIVVPQAAAAAAIGPAVAPAGLPEEPLDETPKITKLPKRTTSRWAVVALALLGAIAATAFLGGQALGYFGKPYFTMVSVTGLNYHTAARVLAAKGLATHDIPKNNPNPRGVVYEQGTPPGKLVQRGDIVNLKVSLGPASVPVQYVRGTRYYEARAALQKQGFHVSLVFQLPPQGSRYGTGIVFAELQNGKPVTEAAYGSNITLYVAKGLAPVSVPSVVNDNIVAATQAIAQRGLDVSPTEQKEPTTAVQSGFVIGTNPAAGSVEPQGTVVTLIVSAGPPRYVPNVIGETVASAESNIRGQGLIPSVVYGISTSSPPGTVYNQNPTATGAAVQGGTVVTISVNGPSPNISTITGGAQSAPADGSTPVYITVTLRTSNGAPVSGATVSLSATPGTNSTITSASSSAATNSGGVVVFKVIDDVAESVTYSATDATSGITITDTWTVVFTTAPTTLTTTAQTGFTGTGGNSGTTPGRRGHNTSHGNSGPQGGDAGSGTSNGNGNGNANGNGNGNGKHG